MMLYAQHPARSKMAAEKLDYEEFMLNFASFYIVLFDLSSDSMNKRKINGR